MRKVGILLLLVVACSKNELTREEAKRLLSEKSDYPRNVGSLLATKEQMEGAGREFVIQPYGERALVVECVETVLEVTGLAVEGNDAEVEYRTKLERTPFAGPTACTDGYTHKAAFQKFDDGWRVQNPRFE